MKDPDAKPALVSTLCQRQAAILAAMTDDQVGAEPAALAKLGLSQDAVEFVLAMRGLLAHGTLAHCLQRRHRVDYGVFRSEA